MKATVSKRNSYLDLWEGALKMTDLPTLFLLHGISKKNLTLKQF
jgi:hypothetical protein